MWRAELLAGDRQLQGTRMDWLRYAKNLTPEVRARIEAHCSRRRQTGRSGVFRNEERLKTAIFSHCGGLGLYPEVSVIAQ